VEDNVSSPTPVKVEIMRVKEEKEGNR